MKTLPPRSREAYLKAIASLDVEHSRVYQPGWGGAGWTHCNAFAADACSVLGCVLPLLLANDQHDWLLSTNGRENGWLELVDVGAAMAAAELGQPTLASWKNQNGPHGHIAMVVPSTRVGPHIAQAGRVNYQSAPMNWGFGSYIPKLFTHA